MKKISIICPVYNEENVINLFIDEIESIFTSIKDYTYEIILCIDRCSDQTLDVVKKRAIENKNLKALYMSTRFGHQAALLAGIDASDADFIIMMDADLQHPPKLIPSLISKIEEGYDIVFTTKVDSRQMPVFNQISSELYYRIIQLLAETKIHKQAADFRIINKKVIDVFKYGIRERNFFLRGLMSWVGFKQTSIPFVVDARAEGKSKFNLRRLISFALTGVISFSLKPLRIATCIGLLTVLFAITLVIYSLYFYFMEKVQVPGFTSLIIALSFFSGIQLLVLGIVGEYIGAIFTEVKQRPHYIIEQKVNID